MAASKVSRTGCQRVWLEGVGTLRALGLAVLLAGALSSARAATVSVTPDADAFVRSLAPDSNYGAGGALSISGSAALNSSGVQNGLFDTLMRFPLSNVVASLDATLGGTDWVLTGARLLVTEMAVPDNDIFAEGVGAFEVLWQATNSWVEGTGKPRTPTSDGVTWNDLPGLVNSNLDTSLGIFTNAGTDGQEAFSLALAAPFVADVRQGGEVSLHLTAVSPAIGFNFNSRSFGNTNAQPVLELTALPNPRPVIDHIALAGADISVTFTATTNWVYRLQRTDTLAGNPPAAWTDVLTIPVRSVPTNVVFMETRTNQQGLYRLSVSQ